LTAGLVSSAPNRAAMSEGQARDSSEAPVPIV